MKYDYQDIIQHLSSTGHKGRKILWAFGMGQLWALGMGQLWALGMRQLPQLGSKFCTKFTDS